MQLIACKDLSPKLPVIRRVGR